MASVAPGHLCQRAKSREEVFEGMTPEEIAKVPYRHIHLQPMKQELLEKDQAAARKFSSFIRNFGKAAETFLKVEKVFEPDDYFRVLETMENGGQIWFGKLMQTFPSLVAAVNIIQAFDETIRHAARSRGMVMVLGWTVQPRTKIDERA